jgi:hypothetical protein
MTTTNSGDSTIQARLEAKKKLIEELKTQWKLLWSERFDDRVRAEGVSVNDYAILDIDKGTIIHATKDFKVLSLRQILEKHLVQDPERYIQPDVETGGWNKFVKTEITGKVVKRNRPALEISNKSASTRSKQQPKKSGRGWLHAT